MTNSDRQNELDQMNSQVVAKVAGRDVTRGELLQAFNRVASKANWKNPIKAEVFTQDEVALAVIREAVIFFAGCRPTFTKTWDGWTKVEAVGYYQAVGA